MGERYKNSEVLEQLYWDEGMSMDEIADRLGCNSGTVWYWMDKHDIKSRDRMEEANRTRRKGDRLSTDGGGYECWRYGRGEAVRLHRLAAVAKFGFEAVANNHVHHKNRVPWDNRLSNLSLLEPSSHLRMHTDDQPRTENGFWATPSDGADTAGAPWKDPEALQEAYETATTRTIANEWGCTRGNILHWMEKHGIERRGRGEKPPKPSQ
jgi:transposase-like protein